MQLMIDLLAESPATIRLAANFLAQHADLLEAAAAPQTSELIPPRPVPQVPQAPMMPTMPQAPTAPQASVVPQAPQIPQAPVELRYDSAGMPWDERIHNKAATKKKDGTYKLKKNLDPQILETVTRELQASGMIRGIGPTSTPVTVGASAPVSLPDVPPPPVQAQTQNVVPFPPFPGQGQTPGQAQAQTPGQGQTQAQGSDQAQAPVSLSPAMPVPPASNVGVSNTANAGVVPPSSDFRSLIAKITKARQENKLSAEQVNACVAQAGAPSLQLLASMPHLIGEVDSQIDAILLCA